MVERVVPARQANVESDVTVPLLQAAACGVIAAVLVTALVLLANDQIGWYIPWWSGVIAGLVVLTWLFFRFIGEQRDSLFLREQRLNIDLNNDGHVGPPPAKPNKIELDITDTHPDREAQFRIVTLFNVGDEQFANFAHGVTRLARPLAEGEWTPNQNGFSINRYRDFIQQLADARLVEYIDPAAPRQGRQLTAAGRAILKKAADSYTETLN
jgi:hypothetical protein